MVDKPNDLNDFFAAQKKKPKRKNQKATQEASKAEDTTADKTEIKQDEVKQPSAAETSKAPVKAAIAFEDSDEEAEANIIIKDELKSKFKDKKDAQNAAKKNEKQADDIGWNLGGNLRGEAREEPKIFAAPTGGAQKAGLDGIRFGAKPNFSRASKGIVNKMEFPELGEIGSKANDKAVYKKDMGYQDIGGSSAASSKPREEKPKMPVFTGRLNLSSGTTAQDIMNSKQNYDMSSLKMSAAASKSDKDRVQGEERGQRTFAAGDDDFEVVTEKKRTTKKTTYGESDLVFGDKPQYSRGGRGRFQ